LERATSTAPAAVAAGTSPGLLPWFAGLAGIMLVAGIALFSVTKPAGTGYTIEEES
ncbi:MAG: hypothetical protein RLZZ283_94, partial [Candidatus Parcubacteria bacterium]